MKKVRFIVDGVRQFLFWKKNIRQTKEGHFVCSNANELEEWEEWEDLGRKEVYNVYFDTEDTAEILERMGMLWGNFNNWCPPAHVMAGKAREWERKYGAEITEIAHDSLVFHCNRRLQMSEVDELMRELDELPSNAIDLGSAQSIRDKQVNDGIFVLWWD